MSYIKNIRNFIIITVKAGNDVMKRLKDIKMALKN